MGNKIFYDFIEAGEILGLNVHAVRSLVKKETLFAEKLTNKFYIHKLELDRFLKTSAKTMVKKEDGVFTEEDGISLLSCDKEKA